MSTHGQFAVFAARSRVAKVLQALGMGQLADGY